jgi:diguanylate cyclase (GGDEF)-like protein
MRIGTVRAFETTQLQAATDSLTGLPNRRTLEQRMRALSTRGDPYAIVMCDLDRFKLLNDTHGHAAGDNALRLFAEALRQSLRETDAAGRWGGEEFAFVLAKANAAAANEMVQRLRKRLAQLLAASTGPKFTASFGIADTSMSARAEDMIQMADVALYQAKASGRDRACIADPSATVDEAPARVAEAHGQGVDAASVAQAAVTETAAA